MQNRPIQILVCCGSGIATSAVAVDGVEMACKELGIKYHISKGAVMNIKAMAPNFDVVFTTNNYKENVACPVMNVLGFVTGINESKTMEEVKNLILKICNEL